MKTNTAKKWSAIIASLIVVTSSIRAQSVLFSFDDIPVYSSFPITHTLGGITANFSGTGTSYSIQAANVLGFTPAGFSGNVVYPNSINQADLLISFDQKITDFSIMYSVQELACDTSATMQVVGYMKGAPVVTSYTVAAVPGTWPVDTLKCTYAPGFDSAVVHFYSHPSRCADWGPIFMADNMKVTPYLTGMVSLHTFIDKLIIPNPVSQSSSISLSLARPENLKISIYDMTGRLVSTPFQGFLETGEHQINLGINSNAFESSGIYLLKITEMDFTRTYKLSVAK